jgi:Tfp pilus assembly protein PilX
MKSPVLVVLALLSVAAACAQTENARISGRVTDLTGAVIVGAEWEITNIETGVSVTTTTNKDGKRECGTLRVSLCFFCNR